MVAQGRALTKTTIDSNNVVGNCNPKLMRILPSIFVVVLCVSVADAQKLNDIDAININTKFTLELTPESSNNHSYKIVSTEPFEQKVKMSSAFSLLDKNIESNQIQGILTIGTFGSQRSVLLVMKNGHENPLQYELLIDVKGKGKFKKTSTHPLNPSIPSTEIWPYYIHSVKIASFQEIELEPLTIPEPKIDSTCLLNPELTVKNGELLFKQNLKKVNSGLLGKKDFKLEKMLSIEDSIQSEDVSLGHFYSLGEGIYPFFKNYKFGNPLRYRRVECPYFDGYSTYFYTKKEKNLKVAGYQWGEFKLSDWPVERVDRTELRNAFESKYESIKNIVTEILGQPIPTTDEPNSGRIDTKWKSADGINAYLFMFGNYNEISLYVFRD